MIEGGGGRVCLCVGKELNNTGDIFYAEFGIEGHACEKLYESLTLASGARASDSDWSFKLNLMGLPWPGHDSRGVADIIGFFRGLIRVKKLCSFFLSLEGPTTIPATPFESGPGQGKLTKFNLSAHRNGDAKELDLSAFVNCSH